MKATEQQLKRLKRKSNHQMAHEQHPESADVIIEMQARMDRLEKDIRRLSKENRGQEIRIQKLMAEEILGWQKKR